MGARLAGLGATAIVGAALALRATMDGAIEPLPDRLVPGLIAAAFLCVTGLTVRRAPHASLFAAMLAAVIGGVEIVAVVRSTHPLPAGDLWLRLTVLAAVASLGATAIAASYAVAKRSTANGGSTVAILVPILVTIAVVIVTAGEAWALVSAIAGMPRTGGEPDVVPIRVATRLMLGATAAMALIGTARDLQPPAVRAWRRRERDRSGFLRLFAEELVPAWANAKRAASDDERARLAADLHAQVLPDLRSALAATLADDPSSALSGRLRETVGDLEALMAGRHSVVLEEFGLLASLEWLAERIEERTGAAVSIEIDDEPPMMAGRPPRDVERAAFRVGLLAVENAVRHAAGSAITIRASIAARAVGLEIADAGPGVAPNQAGSAAQAGRRGLADMRTEAAHVGAELSMDAPGDPETKDQGTRVVFRWPAPRL